MFTFLRASKKASVAIMITALLIFSLPANVILTHAQSFSDDFSAVDAYINETMRALSIKGVALSIVKGDQIIYMQGYGIANAQGDPATPQTPWPMGSVTKSFTALAIRQLVVEKKVDLDAPVQTYLPEFQLADPAAASAITIRHLIDHTSGISKLEGEAPYLNSPTNTFAENLVRLAEFKPAYLPGQHEEYCNWNYVLLAQVVSRVSGQTYVDYVREHIFTPLGMSRSTFADYHSIPQVATGNLISYGISVPYDEKYYPVMAGASLLTSTSEDMAHYLSLALGEGRYLDQSLLPMSGEGRFGPMWHWMWGRPAPDTVYGLSGGYNSISTSCLSYPGQDMGVVLLLNTRLDQLPGVSAYDIARGIGDILLGQPAQAPSGFTLYKPWLILDGSFLLLVAAIVWQMSRLKGWRTRYQSSRGPVKVLAWLGIVVNLLIMAVIIYLPTLLGVRWDALFSMRPDIAIPLIAIAAFLGVIGLFKAVRNLV
ncbi:MAG TPA: serine hydrolase domain-containing protein [Anaerolineaceae bacterium]|nr:serine hydrolase domain-containing protein [Anaerolineaceae bacterium]